MGTFKNKRKLYEHYNRTIDIDANIIAQCLKQVNANRMSKAKEPALLTFGFRTYFQEPDLGYSSCGSARALVVVLGQVSANIVSMLLLSPDIITPSYLCY